MKRRRGFAGVALILAVMVGLFLVPAVSAEIPPFDCYVRIVKEVEPADPEQVFQFHWAYVASIADEQVFELRHGEDFFFNKSNLGGLSITEEVPVGWELPGIECEYDPVDTEVTYYAAEVEIITSGCDQVECVFTNRETPPPPPPETPFVPEASTLILLGSAASGLAGYAGLQWRARRRK